MTATSSKVLSEEVLHPVNHILRWGGRVVESCFWLLITPASDLAKPSKEQLALQTELQRLQSTRKLDAEEFDNQKQVLQAQLQSEVSAVTAAVHEKVCGRLHPTCDFYPPHPIHWPPCWRSAESDCVISQRHCRRSGALCSAPSWRTARRGCSGSPSIWRTSGRSSTRPNKVPAVPSHRLCTSARSIASVTFHRVPS